MANLTVSGTGNSPQEPPEEFLRRFFQAMREWEEYAAVKDEESLTSDDDEEDEDEEDDELGEAVSDELMEALRRIFREFCTTEEPNRGLSFSVPPQYDPEGEKILEVRPAGSAPLSPIAFDKKIPVRFESWAAAWNDVGGRFPGGQAALFQGLYTDNVTGLSYARARWYDARNAAWLSEDPAGAVDSVNRYAFVGWRPTIRGFRPATPSRYVPSSQCWCSGQDRQGSGSSGSRRD